MYFFVLFKITHYYFLNNTDLFKTMYNLIHYQRKSQPKKKSEFVVTASQTYKN